MKRMFLATTVAIPCLIAAGYSCSSDDSAFVPPKTTSTTSGTTTGGPTTTGGTTTSTTSATTTSGAGGGTTTTATTAVGVGGAGPGAGGAGPGGGGGVGGAGGSGGAPGICTNGDCTAVIKTAGGKAMDGWANIDPPASTTPPDGHQGPSMIDNVASTAMTAGIPCVSTETAGGRPLKVAHWQLAGPGIVAGTNYAVTLHLWGVVECKTYLPGSLTNCTRETNPGRGLTVAHDLWCPGATDPVAPQTDHYNTYMLSVTPTSSANTPNLGGPGGVAPAAGNWWMLNECPSNQGTETHTTWRIDYEKTITVPAGSWINYTEYDTNCLEIINCGDSADAAGVCNNHYTFANFPNAIPQPDPTLNLTGTTAAASGVGGFGQWIFFDVRSVTPM